MLNQKCKLMESKEKLNPELNQMQFPQAWIMDQFLSNLIEIIGPKSELALQITLLAIEYDKKCAKAKIELYDAIKELIDQPGRPKL
jgi:hypothetical protein